jgi:hypothetical protein
MVLCLLYKGITFWFIVVNKLIIFSGLRCFLHTFLSFTTFYGLDILILTPFLVVKNQKNYHRLFITIMSKYYFLRRRKFGVFLSNKITEFFATFFDMLM